MAAELISGLRRREQASYQRLLAEYGPGLYRIALRLTGHQQDAEDVLQESLLTVMARIDTLSHPDALGAWLRRVVVNAALMRLRSRRREPVPELEVPEFDFTPEGDRVRRVCAWPPLPEDEVLHREARDVLAAAVARLPAGARQVYLLAEVESVPYGEVADILNISEGAVRTRLHRARLALREVLEDYFAERRGNQRQPR
jgi:RNA polymerase sigma-70 factor (ECF subfamily)